MKNQTSVIGNAISDHKKRFIFEATADSLHLLALQALVEDETLVA